MEGGEVIGFFLFHSRTTPCTADPTARMQGGMPLMMSHARMSGRTTARINHLILLASMVGIIAFSGCSYKGGKVIDGTNLAIGMTIPGTEWSINALDYVGGIRVAGQDSTHIVVTNDVEEDSSYFGCVTIKRHSKMTADIEPLESAKEIE